MKAIDAIRLASKEHQRIVEAYNLEMQKITLLYPCILCASPKYILSADGFKKACEIECVHLKAYSKIVEEYQGCCCLT